MEQFLKNSDLLDIWKEYDAFYIIDRNGEYLTYKVQFQRLRELLKDDEKSQRALLWISNNYDSHHKNKFEEKNNDNPFYYIQSKINDLYNKKITDLLSKKYGKKFKGYDGNNNCMIIGIGEHKYEFELDEDIKTEEDILNKLEETINNLEESIKNS